MGRVDWRPYWATGIALTLALALNLASGNALWTYYTLTGFIVFFVIVGLQRLGRWSIPPAAVWAVGLTAALHYGGGSLSGLHTIGGPNGLYYAFPWWDNVVHALGSGALAVAAFAVLQGRVQAPRALLALCAASVAISAGVLVEVWEFAQFLWLGTVDQGYYTNTVLDLYYNALGAAAGVVLYARGRRSEAPQATSPLPA